VALPRIPALTDWPIALAASAWVTTRQELKLAVEATVVVVAATDVADVVDGMDVPGVPVVGGAPVFAADVPHAASRTVAEPATMMWAMLGRSFMEPPLRSCRRWIGRGVLIIADLSSSAGDGASTPVYEMRRCPRAEAHTTGGPVTLRASWSLGEVP